MKILKVVMVALLVLSFSTVGLAQTTLEKKCAKRYLQYYGYLPSFDLSYERILDTVKVEAFLYGGITVKQGLLKTFIMDILLPVEQATKDKVQAKLTKQENLVTALQNYVK